MQLTLLSLIIIACACTQSWGYVRPYIHCVQPTNDQQFTVFYGYETDGGALHSDHPNVMILDGVPEDGPTLETTARKYDGLYKRVGGSFKWYVDTSILEIDVRDGGHRCPTALRIFTESATFTSTTANAFSGAVSVGGNVLEISANNAWVATIVSRLNTPFYSNAGWGGVTGTFSTASRFYIAETGSEKYASFVPNLIACNASNLPSSLSYQICTALGNCVAYVDSNVELANGFKCANASIEIRDGATFGSSGQIVLGDNCNITVKEGVFSAASSLVIESGARLTVESGQVTFMNGFDVTVMEGGVFTTSGIVIIDTLTIGGDFRMYGGQVITGTIALDKGTITKRVRNAILHAKEIVNDGGSIEARFTRADAFEYSFTPAVSNFLTYDTKPSSTPTVSVSGDFPVVACVESTSTYTTHALELSLSVNVQCPAISSSTTMIAGLAFVMLVLIL